MLVSTKTPSRFATKWTFSQGDISEAPEDDDNDVCWHASVSTVPVDWDDDSSIVDEDDFAEDVVEDIKKFKVSSPTSSPPSPKDNALLYNCYKEFKEMSCSPSPRQPARKSLLSHSTHSARPSSRRKKYNQRLSMSDHNRLSQSDHNRDLIRKSLTNVLKWLERTRVACHGVHCVAHTTKNR